MTDVRLDELSADDVIAHLGLEYLDGEGVWIRVLWRTEHANAIYCLLTPTGFSALHRLQEDEFWVHVAGADVEQLILHPSGAHDHVVLGTHLHTQPQSLVPARTWQAAGTMGEWSLVVCSLAPAFSGFELADRTTDLSAWPAVAERARGFIRA